MLAAPRPHTDELLVFQAEVEQRWHGENGGTICELAECRSRHDMNDYMYFVERCYAQCRTPDSQSSEPGFESPFGTVSKFGHFRSLR